MEKKQINTCMRMSFNIELKMEIFYIDDVKLTM